MFARILQRSLWHFPGTDNVVDGLEINPFPIAMPRTAILML